jgi:16S rRNA (uracil1498-N3)-methyltransferase
MKFIYHKDVNKNTISLQDKSFLHIFKARRTKQKIGEIFLFRNMQDDYLYEYKLEEIDKKSATFTFFSKKINIIKNKKSLHIGWCIIDIKEIEKNILILNELGVNEITFIYCKKSQANFKINDERIANILISSSQQCGRSDFMKISTLNSLHEFKKKNPSSYMLNFSTNYLSDSLDIDTIVIGCEGGFDKTEIDLFEDKIIGLNTNTIFKSSSIAVAMSSKILFN